MKEKPYGSINYFLNRKPKQFFNQQTNKLSVLI